MQTCKVPFTGLYLQTTGNIVLCCHSQIDTLAHINDIDDLESFYNSKVMQYYRDELNKGNIETLHPCKNCIYNESLGHETFRQRIDKFYKFPTDSLDHQARKLGIDTPIRYLEYTLSNICNADCSTCSSFFSSKWAKVDKKMGRTVYPLTKVDDSAVEKIEKVLYGLNYLEIKGGEPFADVRNLRILNKLAEVNPYCNVSIVSNMHTITPESMQIIKKIPNLKVYASIDGVGKVYDWIRGGNFNKTVETMEEYYKQTKNKLQIGATISLYNFFNLEDIYYYFKDKEYIDNIVFHNWAIMPKYVNCDLLPKDVFEERQTKLIASPLDYKSRTQSNLKQNYTMAQAIIEMEKMNKHRGFDLRDHVPEINRIYEY